MKDEEFEQLQLMFQLHKLIAEGKGNDDEADKIRDCMDVPYSYENVGQLNQISCWCYALTNIDKGKELEKTYRDILFGSLYGKHEEAHNKTVDLDKELDKGE